MKVYLAGSIELVDRAYASAWREEATETVAKFFDDTLSVVNPMTFESAKEWSYDEEIVNTDKALLAACHAVLLDGRQPGWGSGMEVMLAYSLDIPVVVWGIWRHQASIWLRHHATTFVPTVSEGLEYLYTLSGALW